MNTKKLRQRLDRAKSVAPSPPIFVYLEAVYRLRRAIRKEGDEAKKIRELAPKAIRRNLYRQIVELTTGKHVRSKDKGRYANALRWAHLKKIPGDELAVFLKKETIHGADKKFRTWKKKRRQKGNAPEGDWED